MGLRTPTAADRATYDIPVALGQDFTLMSVLHMPTGGAIQSSLDDDLPAGTRHFQFRWENTGSTFQFIRFNTGGSAFTAATASGASYISGGVPFVVMARSNGASAQIWVRAFRNGLAPLSGSATITGTPTSGTGFVLCGGTRGPGANTFAGTRVATAIWRAPLSDAEIQSHLVNPWQIFEPEEDVMWAPVAVGGGFQPAWARGANTVLVGGRLAA